MIGERIKGLRLELGVTQKELGEKIGVEKSTINKYELGKIAIPYKKIEKIAAALETTPAYLMGWEEEDKTKDEIDREAQEMLDAYNRASPEIRAAIQRILCTISTEAAQVAFDGMRPDK